jgi:antitoxin Phd
MRERNIWKLQDAEARFSEVVRRARAGTPQQVTVHGKEAVVVVDPKRFEIRAKPPAEPTLAGFVERSKKYRGAGEGIKFGRRWKMGFRDNRTEVLNEKRVLPERADDLSTDQRRRILAALESIKKPRSWQ